MKQFADEKNVDVQKRRETRHEFVITSTCYQYPNNCL